MSKRTESPATLSHSGNAYDWRAQKIKTGLAFSFLAYLGTPGQSEAALICSGNSTVSNGQEMQLAIDCFNAQTPVGSHKIILGKPVDAPESGLNEIHLSSQTASLTIDGSGFGITAANNRDVFVITGSAKVSVSNISVEGANRAFYVGRSAGIVAIDNTTLRNNRMGMYGGGGRISFTNSQANENESYGLYIEDVYAEMGPFRMEHSSASHNGKDGINLFSTAKNFDVAISYSHFDSNGEDGIEVFYSKGLSLKSNTVESNQTGIRLESATVNIKDSDISENATGMHMSIADSNVKVVNTNMAHNGTGISVVDGKLQLLNSTIAYSVENGISASMGRDSKQIAELLISNSTVSSNGSDGAGDGIVTGGAKLAIAHSIFTHNMGDGVVGDENTSIYSSIISKNDIGNAGYSNCAGNGNGLVDLGFNFSDDASCPGFTQSTKLELGPLQDNGCDTPVGQYAIYCVDTHEPSSENPAINSGNCDEIINTTPSIPAVMFDQREAPRDAKCDAGPIEAGSTEMEFLPI